MTGTDRAIEQSATGNAGTGGRAEQDWLAVAGELPDALFDRMARLAARLVDAQMALVILGSAHEPVIKGRHGWTAGCDEAALELAGLVLGTTATISVADARADPAWSRAGAVQGRPRVRFLAAVPIRGASGEAFGTLCVADCAPRGAVSPEHAALLEEVTELVALQLDGARLARQRLTDFIETGSDWLWETDAEHRFSHFAELHEIFVDDSADHDIGRRRWELPGVDSGEPRWAAHRADLDARRPFRNFEYATQDVRGGRHHVRVSGKPVFDDDGRFLGYRGTASDVTEQKHWAEQLAASEARFRYLFDRNPNPMWVFDARSLRFLEVNHAAVELYGYSRKEFLAMTVLDIRAPEEALRLREAIESDPPASFGEAGIWRHRAKDGREISVEVVRNELQFEGRSAYVVAVRDVTERVRAEAALRESEDRFRQIADSIPGIVWLTDADARLTFLNRAFEEYTGKSAPSCYGKTSSESAHPEDAARLTPLYEAAAHAHQRLTYEYRVRRYDGQYRWFLDTCVPRFDDAGRFLGYIGMAADVHDMRQLSEQLHQAQKMQAVGQLTGGVAHDFNNLLTVILGNSELLAERLAEPKLRRLADTTRDAAERSAALVQRLLAFSRRQTLQPVAVDVNELVQGMRELLVRTLGEDVEIGFSFAPGQWVVTVDPSQFEAAIINLAINARDAMPGGGRLTIETSDVDIDDVEVARRLDVLPGRYVLVALSDNGCGMNEEVRRQAFEPFYTTKDVGKGSGLGLSMVYGFIKQSGGHVTLYSEVGHGTTIKIYLPRADAAAARPAPSAAAANAEGGGETILLVEDDERVRAYVAGQLRGLGYAVVEAGSGPEALVALERTPEVSLLFTDVVMPGGMNGRQLVDEALRRFPAMRVLFTTGYTENAIVHHGRLDPGVELLGKPFTRAALASKVRAVLDRER